MDCFLQAERLSNTRNSRSLLKDWMRENEWYFVCRTMRMERVSRLENRIAHVPRIVCCLLWISFRKLCRGSRGADEWVSNQVRFRWIGASVCRKHTSRRKLIELTQIKKTTKELLYVSSQLYYFSYSLSFSFAALESSLSLSAKSISTLPVHFFSLMNLTALLTSRSANFLLM